MKLSFQTYRSTTQRSSALCGHTGKYYTPTTKKPASAMDEWPGATGSTNKTEVNHTKNI